MAFAIPAFTRELWCCKVTSQHRATWRIKVSVSTANNTCFGSFIGDTSEFVRLWTKTLRRQKLQTCCTDGDRRLEVDETVRYAELQCCKLCALCVCGQHCCAAIAENRLLHFSVLSATVDLPHDCTREKYITVSLLALKNNNNS